MKNIYTLIIALLLVNVYGSQAQQKHCFTDEVYRENIRLHPEYLLQEQQLEEFTRNFILHNDPAHRIAHQNGTSTFIYVVPIVFHIIHEYGPENISDAQIKDAVRILNRDYRKQNADTADIIPEFVSLAADVEIEFRLATLDSAGNCTNGIERIYSYRTNLADDLAKLNPWPANRYLNIWTVAKFNASHATAAAYATRPGTSSPFVDGVISLSNYVGSIGTSSVSNSRTLTHEIGHYFNLSHPWGNTNQPGVSCGDDGVSDTPITKGWSQPVICPNPPPYDICNAGIKENFQNYMDYSYCDRMFTIGQRTRMQAALNSTVSWRNNLWSTTNLIATGTNGTATPTCRPIADFYLKPDHICIGDSVQYFSNSQNADTINYSWSFPSGTPSTSTAINPYVNYSTPGSFDATLTVSNSGGTNSITKTSIVTASGSPLFIPTYFDDFETVGTFPGTGYIINDAGFGWQRFNTPGSYSGTNCIRLLNYNQAAEGLVDSWITPAIQMSGCNTSVLTFRMAYAQKDVSKTDALKIYISTSCGRNWQSRRVIQGAQLASVPTVTIGFVPSSPSQWMLVTVGNIAGINGRSDARFKFEFVSGGDNNIYIDDINLTADCSMGINDVNASSLNFDVFPNPANDVFSITFETKEFTKSEITVSDLLGREIKTIMKDQLGAGSHEYNMNAGQFSKGIYLVRLKAGDITTVKKLVIE